MKTGEEGVVEAYEGLSAKLASQANPAALEREVRTPLHPLLFSRVPITPWFFLVFLLFPPSFGSIHRERNEPSVGTLFAQETCEIESWSSSLPVDLERDG